MARRHKSVIVDECVGTDIATFLEENGEEVIRISDGRSDSSIRYLGYKTGGAYIVTKDKEFKNYKRAIIVRDRESPKSVYERLLRTK